MPSASRKKPKRNFERAWVFEAFDRDPTFFDKRMFGGLAAYCRGRMVMVLTENPGEKKYRGKTYGFDIWDGILLPTEREYHGSLTKKYPSLISHPVLGKWLYLAASNENFETIATEIAGQIAKGDPRFGIEPKIKGKTGKSKKGQRHD